MDSWLISLAAPARRPAIVAEGAGAVALDAHGAAGGALLAGVTFRARFAAERAHCRSSRKRGERRVANGHLRFLDALVAELFEIVVFADRLGCNGIRYGGRNII